VGVILGSAVAVLWGTGDLFAALAARRFGSIRTLAIAQSTELALCVGLWVLFPSLLNSAPVPIAPLLFIGVLTAVSYGALYQGLMLGPVMIVAPIAGAYAVGPVVLAVAFLDEQLSMTQRFGVTAAIAGVVAVTAGERKAPWWDSRQARSCSPRTPNERDGSHRC
jgi:uncharacterized membrane protein